MGYLLDHVQMPRVSPFWSSSGSLVIGLELPPENATSEAVVVTNDGSCARLPQQGSELDTSMRGTSLSMINFPELRGGIEDLVLIILIMLSDAPRIDVSSSAYQANDSTF